MRPRPRNVAPRPQGCGVDQRSCLPASVGCQDIDTVRISIVGNLDRCERVVPSKIQTSDERPSPAHRRRVDTDGFFGNRKHPSRAEAWYAPRAGFKLMGRISFDDGTTLGLAVMQRVIKRHADDGLAHLAHVTDASIMMTTAATTRKTSSSTIIAPRQAGWSALDARAPGRSPSRRG